MKFVFHDLKITGVEVPVTVFFYKTPGASVIEINPFPGPGLFFISSILYILFVSLVSNFISQTLSTVLEMYP